MSTAKIEDVGIAIAWEMLANYFEEIRLLRREPA